MPLSSELVFRATKFDVRALEDVLSQMRPAVHRLAVGLTGDERRGRSLARLTLAKSLRLAPTWRDAADVERWFYHHTILAARPYATRPPRVEQDALLPRSLANNLRAIAFLKALRGLSLQQREAYILTHGERLAPRPMATAMDCSLDASGAHLAHAERTLKAITAEDYAALEHALATRYAELTPAGDETLSLVRGAVRRHVWPRRLKVLVTGTLLLVTIAAIGWAVWKVYPMLEV